jgi:nitroreductase
MGADAAVRDYLLTRRSVTLPFLKEPGPTEEELRQLLTIGTRVPDHGKLAPWRLVLYRGDVRITIGNRLAEIYKMRHPEVPEQAIEEERKRFLPAPLTIGVVSTAAPHIKIPEFEQLLSAGNVAFNLLHGAFALGYGAHWVTRWFAFDEEAAQFLGAKPGERFVGFVHIGTPEVRLEDRDRPVLADIVTEWRG